MLCLALLLRSAKLSNRTKLRRFHYRKYKFLNSKLHDRKLPACLVERYRLIALVYLGFCVLSSRRLVCAKEAAERMHREAHGLTADEIFEVVEDK